MSSELRLFAMKRSKSRGLARVLLAMLAHRAHDQSGVCNTDFNRIVGLTKKARTKVRAALHELEAAGEIRYLVLDGWRLSCFVSYMIVPMGVTDDRRSADMVHSTRTVPGEPSGN